MVRVRVLAVVVALAVATSGCSDSDGGESSIEAASAPASTSSASGGGDVDSTSTSASAPSAQDAISVPGESTTTSVDGPTETTVTVPPGGALPSSIVVGQRRPFFAHVLDGHRISTSDGAVIGPVEGHLRAPSAAPDGSALVEIPLIDLPEYDEDLLLEYGNGAQLTFGEAKSRAEAGAVQLMRAPDGSTVTFNHSVLASSWFAHGGSWWEDVLPDGRIVGMWADEGWSGVFVESDDDTDLGARLGEDRAYVGVAAQRTGNLVVVEADPFTGLDPVFHVVDPDDGSIVASFPTAAGASQVLGIDYDPSRTWLAVLYDGGLVEILGSGTRTLLELPDDDYHDIAW